MIKTCYTNIEYCVELNGFTSIYFNLSRGIRQGCPISTLLYILVAETLAEAVRVESEIKGIKLPDRLTGWSTQTTETRPCRTLTQ